jgi:hypothetical protein
MNETPMTQEELDVANEELAKVLTDANVTLNPFDLIMLKIDMVLAIMIDHRIISETDLDLKWSMFLNEHLTSAMGIVKQQAETIERETDE